VARAQSRHEYYQKAFVPWCRAETQCDKHRVPGYKFFMRVLRECFPKITWTNKMRFSQCKTCHDLNKYVRNSSGKVRRAFSLLKGGHLEMIRNERFFAIRWG